uniref:Putative pogo family transposase n=1 Tax=Ixodes scapularis TaxID=6945 RepID=A0A4D5RYT6_IXOSC
MLSCLRLLRLLVVGFAGVWNETESRLLSENVRVTCSRNGWMTTPVFLEWVRRVWGANKDDVRRLLVLDQAPIHKTEAAREALDGKETDVVFIPGGCTSILQPADVCWMKPFKDALRNRWSSFLREGAVTAKGNLKKPSRQDVVSFVSEAWASLSEEAVLTSFKRCGISTRLDGSEDGELNHRLASVSDEPAMGPEARESIVDEVVQLVFDSDSDESFDGFSDDE